VKRLIDAQGGSVSLSVRDGGGTAAEIVLPLKQI
jgi:chemotaxis protein histidine kinase CheA